ncbi:MAG: prenyltransferase/squalene oxidase repeat-containing protein [Bryobacteraceae bacterium]|nr:prenyltransferase/squalene oxidase repeat-containing protein [Bryobacteraceae bacterium]
MHCRKRTGIPEGLRLRVLCHNQSLPQIAYVIAKERGIAVDKAIAEKQSKSVMAMYKPAREPMLQRKEIIPDPAISVSYALLGMAAEAYPGDETTAAMAHLISTQQNPDGSFRCLPARPPMESSKVTATALSIRVLQVYGANVDAVIAQGREWLRTAPARTTEERAMKLLGLAWSKAAAADIRAAAKMLLNDQRADGGWGQLPMIETDAYATGQAMYALQTAGMVTPHDDAYMRGAGFLLRTQRPDGSWLVRSRSNPFQPLKESGFPHGRDQWISAAGTSWAAMALGTSLPVSATQISQTY